MTHLPPRYARWVQTVRRAETRIRSASTRHRLTLAFPRDGDEVVIDPGAPPIWQLRARRGPVEADARFEVDGVPIGGEWRVRPGRHQVVAIAGDERSAPVSVRVRSLRRSRGG